MGNASSSTNPNGDKMCEWTDELLTRRLQVCEAQVLADQEREERIQHGRPVVHAVDKCLQAVFSELHNKSRSRKRTALDFDRLVVAEHHSWASRQMSTSLAEIERSRLMTSQVKRPLDTLEHYTRVVNAIKCAPVSCGPSAVLKKQRLITTVKRQNTCRKQTAKYVAHTRAVLASVMHDLLSQKEELSLPMPSSLLPLSPPLQKSPPVLWVSAVQFEIYNRVLNEFLRKNTIEAVISMTEDERSYRVHNDKLAELHVEFTRALNMQTSLRQMNEEKIARVSVENHRVVLDELTHMYNSIIADYMRGEERESQINKNNFLTVLEQLLRHVHQNNALKEMTAEKEIRIANDKFCEVLEDLSRFYNAGMADCLSDQEKSRRISYPPLAKTIFAPERRSFLHAIERRSNQRLALRAMKEEQARRLAAARLPRVSDIIFLTARMHKELLA